MTARRSTTVIVVAGCTIAVVTYGLRRGDRRVRCDVVVVDRTRPGRGSGPPPDPGAEGAAVGAERGMKLRTHLLIVLVLGLLTFGSAALQAAAAAPESAAGSTLRLVCPLH